MDFFHGVDNVQRSYDISESPPCYGIGFGQRRARDSALPHIGQAREVDVLIRRVDDVLVDLVGDDKGVILLSEVGDYEELLACEDLAAGIGRVAENESLWLLLESSFEDVRVKSELGRVERKIYRLGTRENGISAVILIERGEHDDLVPGIGNGHHRRHHSLGASAGHDYLAVRVDAAPHKAGLLLGESFTEVLSSPRYGILVEVLASYFCEAVENLSRRLEVGEALREVDSAVFI